jgi:hypothetical protein
MVVKEHFQTRTDGVELVRTYSDTGHRIRQVETGMVYDEAVDVAPCRYTYVETEDFVEDYLDETAAKAAAYDILTGGAE